MRTERTVSPPAVGWSRAAYVRFVVIFLASRVALTAVVWLATRGRELSGDVAMHVAMMKAPLEPFLGRGPFAQHPPLLSFVEGVVFRCFEPWLSTFLAVRCSYVLFETLAATLTYAAIGRVANHQSARSAGALLCTLPCGFMVTTVMPQDECIAYAFVASALFALTRNRSAVAIAVLSLGIASAKLLLVIPTAVLVLTLPAPSAAIRLACAVLPSSAVYAGVWIAQQHAVLPRVLQYAPAAAFSVSPWVFLTGHVSPDSARLLSSVAGLALASVALVRSARQRSRNELPYAFATASAALAWFLVGFYLVNPEYYVLLAPAIVLRCRDWRGVSLAFIATALPWIANVAYGIHYRASLNAFQGASGKIALAWLRLIALDPLVLHAVAVIATTIAAATLAWKLQRDAC